MPTEGQQRMRPWHLTLTRVALAALLFCCWGADGRAQAPQGSPPLKEVAISAQAFSVGEPVPAWVEVAHIPEAAQGQPLAMRLADTQYMVRDEPVVYARRAMLINDAASLTRAGHVAIPFVPQYHKVKLHGVRVLRGGERLDRTASSAVRFLQRETGLEFGIYSGEVTASVLVNDLRVGDTLEYEYSIEGQNPVFGGKFVHSTGWDQGLATGRRRVVLNYPEGRKIAWRLLGGSQGKPVVPRQSIADGLNRLVFEEQALPAVEIEPSTPPEHAPIRWLQFSEFQSWAEVATWAEDLFQTRGELNTELRDLVEALKKKPTAQERVAGALEFAQSQIRYFSVSLGESSHRPAPPDLVLERRYGDCKDKSLLLITLLRALAIDARPVLLDVSRRNPLDKALPSPLLFNHAIVEVRVDGRTYYLDPTRLGQHGRLSRMGQVHEGAQVLVVAPRSESLVAIASPNARELARSEVTEAATLDKFDGDAQLRVRQVWHGTIAENLRVLQERVSRDQLYKSIGGAMEQRYAGATLVGEPVITDDRVDNVMSMTATYTVPKLATERDGNWFVRFAPDNMKGILTRPPSTSRTVPLQLPAFPFDARYTFEITLPEEVRAVTDPHTQAVKSKFFTYAVTSSFRGNVSKTTIELATLADQVPAADLRQYSEDLRSVTNILAGVVAVPKAALKTAARARMPKKDLGQMLHDRQQETVDNTTKAIKSGKLTGNDLVSAYCLRGSAHSDLGKFAEAVADGNEAVRSAPGSTAALLCRGSAYYSAGEFNKSIDDFSRAITLGSTGPRTHFQRGIARFYAGKLDEASEDFARATETDDREGQVTYDLWLAWTTLRLGKPLPEAVRARAAEQPRGDWPRPALALLSGTMTPEEMLKQIDRKTGDERKMALSEGYFYLAQYYLAHGDKARARKYLLEARRQNVIIYTEHAAAAFELKRLGSTAETGSLPGGPAAGAPAEVDPKAASPRPAPSAEKKARPKSSRKPGEAWNSNIWRGQ